MRKVVLLASALALSVGALMGAAGSAAAEPEPEPRTVPAWLCLLTGGKVATQPAKPPVNTCKGGLFDGYRVVDWG